MKMERKILVDLLSYTGSKGGTDVYIRKLYESIGRIPHNYSFFAIAPSEARTLDMSWFPGSITYTNFSGNNKITWSMGEIFSITKFANKIKPDLIHCPANFGPLKSKFKIVLTLHDALYWSMPHLAPNRKLLFGVRLMQKSTSKISTAIITDSISSSREIERFLNVPQGKISSIYLGVDFNGITEEVLTNRETFFLAGGNRFRHKNWENLLKAWSLISPNQRPNLIITGGGPRDPLAKLVKKYALSDHVKLLRWVSEAELVKLHAQARAVVIPSFFEGFSLGVLQALATKKPLIASNIPVHSELADKIAFFFDPSSPSDIAKTLLEFGQNEEDLEVRLELGVKKSLNFSWEKCAKETLEVFNRA